MVGRTALLASVALALACARVKEGPTYSATAEAVIPKDMPFTEGRAHAVANAENAARQQVLAQALARTLPDGRTLEEAVIEDPFLRAKVIDIVRTSKLTDQTLKRERGLVTVTIQLDEAPLDRLSSELPPTP